MLPEGYWSMMGYFCRSRKQISSRRKFWPIVRMANICRMKRICNISFYFQRKIYPGTLRRQIAWVSGSQRNYEFQSSLNFFLILTFKQCIKMILEFEALYKFILLMTAKERFIFMQVPFNLINGIASNSPLRGYPCIFESRTSSLIWSRSDVILTWISVWRKHSSQLDILPSMTLKLP